MSDPFCTDSSHYPTPFSKDEKSRDQWIDELVAILTSDSYYTRQLTTLLQFAHDREHRPVNVDVVELLSSESLAARVLGHLLPAHPCYFMPIFDEACNRAQSVWCQQLQSSYIDAGQQSLTIKSRHLIHCRPRNLPLAFDKDSVNDVRALDVGSLITVTGSIVRANSSRVYEFGLKYECKKCFGNFFAFADEEQENRIETPSKCFASEQPHVNAENEVYQERQRQSKSKVCRSTLIEPFSGPDAICPRDIQSLKLQETVDRGSMKPMSHTIPRSITVILKDDLVERVKPGDEVRIVGIVRRQWSPITRGGRINCELYIDGCSVEVLSSIGKNQASSASMYDHSQFTAFWRAHGPHRPLAARDFIVNSFAPSLFGLFLPKLACLLSLIGGVTEEIEGSKENFNNLTTQLTQQNTQIEGATDDTSERGLRIRGDIHVLFVGDAGVGKSQLLQFASMLSPRGIFTTGAGSTSAGLTVAAVREKRKRYDSVTSGNSSSEGGWVLEAGALVLADGGVCCIDEFNSIAKADRMAIHEAMEQQTISVAKAGLVTILNARTAIIAALNPKGDYDDDADVSVNAGLGSPLLSRFDVIFVLLDRQKDEWDEKIAEYVLSGLLSDSDVNVKKQEEDHSDDEEMSESQERHAIHAAINSLHGRRQPAEAKQSEPRTSGVDIARDEHHIMARTNPWTAAQLRSYVSHVKEAFKPELSVACESLLKRYYQQQRRADSRKQARVTVRLLESLVRLTQAHARLMYRSHCIAQDALVAIIIMENSIFSCGLLRASQQSSVWSSASGPTISALHAEFDDEPDLTYRQCAQIIVARLGVDMGEEPYDYNAWQPGSSQLVVQPVQPRHSSVIVSPDEISQQTVPQRTVQSFRFTSPSSPVPVPSQHSSLAPNGPDVLSARDASNAARVAPQPARRVPVKDRTSVQSSPNPTMVFSSMPVTEWKPRSQSRWPLPSRPALAAQSSPPTPNDRSRRAAIGTSPSHPCAQLPTATIAPASQRNWRPQTIVGTPATSSALSLAVSNYKEPLPPPAAAATPSIAAKFSAQKTMPDPSQSSAFCLPDDDELDDQPMLPAARAPTFNPFVSSPTQPSQSTVATQITQTVMVTEFPLPAVAPPINGYRDRVLPPPPPSCLPSSQERVSRAASRFSNPHATDAGYHHSPFSPPMVAPNLRARPLQKKLLVANTSQSPAFVGTPSSSPAPPAGQRPPPAPLSSNLAAPPSQVQFRAPSAPPLLPPTTSNPVSTSSVAAFHTPVRSAHHHAATPSTNTPPPLSAVTPSLLSKPLPQVRATRIPGVVQLDLASDFSSALRDKPFAAHNPFAAVAFPTSRPEQPIVATHSPVSTKPAEHESFALPASQSSSAVRLSWTTNVTDELLSGIDLGFG